MSLRVHNAPDIERIQTADVFKITGANRDRESNTGYPPPSFLGTDALQLSGDYEGKPRSQRQAALASIYSYSNLIKLIVIVMLIGAVIIGSMVALVAFGGLIALVVTALAIFLSLFLYSLNLNPFKRATYKKILGYLH
jgi:hypothetical protein